MRNKPYQRWFTATVVVLVILLYAGAAFAQTTSFTYQGRLTDGGTPANGNYDLQFALFATSSGGTQIGSTPPLPSTNVSNGVFTVQLDFGVSPFSGANRFLEIGVRPAGGGAYTTLSPRQQISSTPYAIRTLSASAADSLSNACTACVQDAQINSVAGSKVSGSIPVASVPAGSGNYVQNTATPQTSSNFNISGNGTIGGSLNVNGAFPNGLVLSNGTASLRGTIVNNSVLLGTTTNSPLTLSSSNGTNNGSVTLDTTGNVGIDAIAPETKLTVHTFGSDYGLTHTNGSIKLVTFLGGNFNGGYFGTRSNHSLHFFTNDSGPLMTVTTAGSVGIGTTAPNAKLFVQGEAANGVGIAATGNASQSLNKGGWVKAMVFVLADGTIARCYNGQTGASSGNCGFTATHGSTGFYSVDFGFRVGDRFISFASVTNLATPRQTLTGRVIAPSPSDTSISLIFFFTDGDDERAPSDFYLIVY